MVGRSQKNFRAETAAPPRRDGSQPSAVSDPGVPPDNRTPDPAQVGRLLASAEGQALLGLLRADGGAGLRAAAEALRTGDTEAAKAALTPLLAGTQAEALTRRMEEKL